jgi:transposase
MNIEEVELAVPEGFQLILGQSHFIKTVDDLYETLSSSMPGLKFGVAFCESSGKALIRHDGTDVDALRLAEDFASRLAAGHSFVVILKGAFPINVLNRVKAVEEVADQLPCYPRLKTLPGVGRILGLTITMETADVERFSTPGHYASYCRCVDTQRQSNGKTKGYNNGKCGNKYLGWAFVEAAHFAIRSDAACRKFYDRKQAQANTMVATKALACKLAKAAWHVMHDNVPYDPARVFPFLRKPAAEAAK